MTMADEYSQHSAMLHVAANHPSLPGHFPGNPIVPGVWLLEQVLECAEQWLARPLSVHSIVQAKFLAPVKPEENARVELKHKPTELRFAIHRGEQLIAQGIFALGGPQP